MERLLQARIKDGKIVFKEPIILSKLLSEFQDKDVVVTISPPKRKTTDRQNRYYFGVILTILAELTGYEKTEMHEICKEMFLLDEKEINGKVFKYSRSTTSLTTVEREQYHTDIREWAGVKLNCFIPLPNEISY